ncbi:bifunctional homocysteine S-methyltransferase/methylenetetrahydrofolate reductase [Eubacteriales bacterium KG127]
MKDIREYIKDDVLIFDGGMGTYFATKYKTMLESCEQFNLTAPEKVYEIHREYLESGARAIMTNTFAANMENYEGDEDQLRKIIHAGFDIASSAAKDHDAYVFADIGYISLTETGNVADKYKKNVDFFLEKGAKHFIFETLLNDSGIDETAKYIKEKSPDSFILVSFAIYPDGYTQEGAYGIELLERAESSKWIDGVGLNCVSGPHHMSEYFATLDKHPKLMLAMPNASYPTVINNRTFFNSTPEYFSAKMNEIKNQGIKMLGGCCGTTPVDIRALRDGLTSPLLAPNSRDEYTEEQDINYYLPEFNKKLARGEKVIAVELDSPLDTNFTKFAQNTLLLKNAGIDLMTIADCPIAKPRMDSSLLACKVKRDYNLDVIPHITCRDRNINATKALLLGLHIENIRNVLVVTGDPIPSYDRDDVKSVYNLNSKKMIKYISNLNSTTFQDSMNLFGALNLNTLNFEIQLKHALEKEANGATGFFTQPILSEKAFDNLKRARNVLKGKILAGTFPVMSYRNAIFMENEIAGINLDPDIIERYKGLSKEDGAKLGISLSVEFAHKCRDYCDGFNLMTPFQRADVICEIIKEIKNI